MSTRHILRSFFVPTFLLLMFLTACSDSTGPGPVPNDGTGQVDPAANLFVLSAVEVPTAGDQSARLELIGSDLELDTDGIHVGLTVALRNASATNLPASLTLWVNPIEPSSVFVANPDTSLPVASIIPIDGFIYAKEFGSDLVLAPGEISTGKLWRFRTQDQGPFSFGIHAELGGVPAGPVISGTGFWDPNRNGVRDPNEGALVPSVVYVTAPDSSRVEIAVADDGRFAYPLHMAGLHRVEFRPLIDTFAPIAFSTPNPRHVIITPDSAGVLRGFHNADFGAYTDLPPHRVPPIEFTEAPLDSLQQAPWNLIGLRLERNSILVCDVGYSGCGPEHRFTLWTDGAFMESQPVQVNAVLVHKTDEVCPAAWREETRFDLGPLEKRFLESYGPGTLVVNVIDFDGVRHPVEWPIGGD